MKIAKKETKKKKRSIGEYNSHITKHSSIYERARLL